MAYVNSEDVLDGYEGVFDPASMTWLQTKIDEAELLLESRLGPLTDWADTDYRQRALRTVVARMVQRVLTNPRGATQQSETTGPFTDQWTLDPRVASGSIWVTTDDWVLLGLSSLVGSQVGTISLGNTSGWSR